MKSIEIRIRRVLCMDHSVKFPKKLKLCEAEGVKKNAESFKMLLLAQNEIGHVVNRRLTRSENNAQTEGMIQSMIEEKMSIL
jgi:hypothetical protein